MNELLERLGIFIARAPDDDNAGGGGDDGKGGDGKGDQGAGGDGKGGDQGKGNEGKTAEQIRADNASRSLAARRSAKPGEEGKGDEGKGDEDPDKGKKPIVGERPSHIPEKFWDPKTKTVKADELAKSYATLETAHAKLRAEKGLLKGEVPETPDGYFGEEGLKVPEDLKNVREIPKDDAAVKVWAKVAHKYNLPKDVTAAIAAEFLTELDPLLPGPPDLDEMMKELGETGPAEVDRIATYMEGLYTRGVFAEDDLSYGYLMAGTPAGIRFMGKLLDEAGERPVPRGGALPGADLPSKEEWYALNRDPRMGTDPAFRAKVEQQADAIFGTEPGDPDIRNVGMPPVRSRPEAPAKK